MKTRNVLTVLLSGSMVAVSYAGTGKPNSLPDRMRMAVVI